VSDYKASTRPSGVYASDPGPTPTAPTPTSPADLTIQRNRAQDTPAEIPAPRPQLPGRRGRGGTVEMVDGQAVFTDHSTSQPSVYVPFQPAAPQTPATAPLIFRKEGTNTRVLAKDVGMADLVDLGGMIGVTTVHSALHNGWLTEVNGSFVRVGEAAPAPTAAEQPEQAVSDKGEPQFLEPMMPEHEASYTAAAERCHRGPGGARRQCCPLARGRP
jgi:hypothetical protein